MSDTLLKISEAAKMLGVSIRTFERWKAAGDIPVVQFGPQTLRYRQSDIQAIILAGGFSRQLVVTDWRRLAQNGNGSGDRNE